MWTGKYTALMTEFGYTLKARDSTDGKGLGFTDTTILLLEEGNGGCLPLVRGVEETKSTLEVLLLEVDLGHIGRRATGETHNIICEASKSGG